MFKDYKSGKFACVHHGPQRLLCIVVYQFRKRVPQVALLGISIYVLCFIVYKLFFLLVPGSFLLNVKSAEIPTTRLGDTMILTICRSSRVGAIQPDAMRTFYRVVANGNPEDGGSYTYKPNIESKDGCYNIPIVPSRYPKTAGTYYAYTSFKFTAGGFKKEVIFQTPPFLLSDTKLTTDAQINALQKQIDDLEDK